MNLNPEYWNNIYLSEKVGWDIGYVSTPLKEYFDQLKNKEIRILIPGAGNAYEVEYLYQKGFKNVFLLDYAKTPVSNFLERLPDFPVGNIIIDDFFSHDKKYDLIVEHTFFSSIHRKMREKYAEKVYHLLNGNGKFIGLLFNHEFGFDYPPFGGSEEEYYRLFKSWFDFKHFKVAYNSIKPRRNREIFFNLIKK